MPEPEQASRIRREIARLRQQRSVVERQLLRRARMLPASLIERHLGTSRAKRPSAAFYLSWAQGGRTRLRHVPKSKAARVRRWVESWRAFRRALRRWKALTDQIARLWRRLGNAQAEDPLAVTL